MPRQLRIAASVFFGLLTVAVVVLWITSYFWFYTLWARYHRLDVLSRLHRGAVILDIDTDQTSSGPGTMPVRHWNADIRDPKYFSRYLKPDKLTVYAAFGFRWTASGSISEIDIPLWAVTLGTVAIAAIPWSRFSHRFSLRTLLIATTLLAVVLGLQVWLAG